MYMALDSVDPVLLYKIKLIARKYIQIESVEFTKMFASLVKLAFMKMILSIVTVDNQHHHQMRAKKNFYNDIQQKLFP